MEQRVGQRRRERGSTDRGVAERRRGDRRARAGAGVLLAIVSLTASAMPDRGYLDARVQTFDTRQPPEVPAVRVEEPIRAAGLRPSLNSEFDVHIDDAAARHGVSRELVRAIIQIESGFDRLAVSGAGARGLMQLMPATARRFGVINRFDARQNIFGGTRYLRALLDHYRGDITLTAAAYNAGVSCVARYHGIPPYKQTQDYVRKVTGLLGAAQREADDGESGEGGKG